MIESKVFIMNPTIFKRFSVSLLLGISSFTLGISLPKPALALQDMSQMPPAQVEVTLAENRLMAPQMIVSG